MYVNEIHTNTDLWKFSSVVNFSFSTSRQSELTLSEKICVIWCCPFLPTITFPALFEYWKIKRDFLYTSYCVPFSFYLYASFRDVGVYSFV